MSHTFTPTNRDELIVLSRQLRAALATITDPAPGDDVLDVDTSGPVQAVTVTDALYEAWTAVTAALAGDDPAPETPPARVETAIADDKPKRRRAPRKTSKSTDTRGA